MCLSKENVYLEFTDLLVEGKVIEPHGTPEGDVCLLAVQNLVTVDNKQAWGVCYKLNEER